MAMKNGKLYDKPVEYIGAQCEDSIKKIRLFYKGEINKNGEGIYYKEILIGGNAYEDNNDKYINLNSPSFVYLGNISEDSLGIKLEGECYGRYRRFNEATILLTNPYGDKNYQITVKNHQELNAMGVVLLPITICLDVVTFPIQIIYLIANADKY